MKVLLGLVVLACVFEASLTGRHKMLEHVMNRNVMNDVVLSIEPFPPDFVSGNCTCKCCEDKKPHGKCYIVSRRVIS